MSGQQQPPPGGGGYHPPQQQPGVNNSQQQQQMNMNNMNPTPIQPGMNHPHQQQMMMNPGGVPGRMPPQQQQGGPPNPMDTSNNSQGRAPMQMAPGTTTTAPAPGATAGAASTTTPRSASASATSGLVKTTTTTTATTPATVSQITDQSVLEYLKQKGMSNAVLELQSMLGNNDGKGGDKKNDDDQKAATSSAGPDGGEKQSQKSFREMKEEFDKADDQARSQRTVLTKSTGGGFGYDRDAAAPIVQWGIPDVIPPTKIKDGEEGFIGKDEARAYLDAFCRLQLWILTLPDDYNTHYGSNVQIGQKTNIFAIAKDWINKKKVAEESKNGDGKQEEKKEAENPMLSLSSLVEAMISRDGNEKPATTEGGGGATITDAETGKAVATTTDGDTVNVQAPFNLPPSSKPELLTVSFALLVHTYCELLEVGMETTAHTLRDSFKPIYDPLYGEQYKDLYHCTTTEDMVKLNTHNSQHMEGLNSLKGILVQIAQYQLKQEELLNQIRHHAQQQNSKFDSNLAQKKVNEYRQIINSLQQKHKELSSRASIAFDRMHDLPFLRRARAVRWQLTLSTSSYGLLSGFLSSNNAHTDTSLLAMSTLLQTKCELHIEQRDPLPFTPTSILLEDDIGKNWLTKRSFKECNDRYLVNWAAPLPRQSSSIEHEFPTAQTKKLPFPKFHLEEEYETEHDARRDKRVVQFNRAMLVNGFRRLEALERKREFEVMEQPSSDIDATDKDGGVGGAAPYSNKRVLTDPMEPSILLATLCANTRLNTAASATAAAAVAASKSSTGGVGGASGSKSAGGNSGSGTTKSKTKKPTGGSGSGATAIAADRHKSSGGATSSSSSNPAVINNIEALWEESGIGLTCAKLCPPDGRRVAVGCDDSAVRIWDLKENGEGEVGQVLLGHKNGFPIFDVSWNKDGRSLLSAGGDGSIRLWDTMAQGPFGSVCAKPTKPPTTPAKKTTDKIHSAQAREALEKATTALEEAKEHPSMTVPELKPESSMYQNGAALAVYRGHAPNTPIWSVAFAPCGYYFASAGGDATARLWTTDHPVPVRLFAGHTSNTVHTVTFHPNCNYILTGGEDKTARLWDIQTGSCVRLLTGCPSGINKVEIDPSGQYAAGADGTGTIHLWDLGTGKKVTQLRSSSAKTSRSSTEDSMTMIHAMSFSACGTALATGGDDRCVKVWDVRKSTTEGKTLVERPQQSFQTRRTILLDLHYTKRNLLLGVGKYITAVPIVPALSD